VIKACDPERLLVESDYNDVNMCAPQTWDMVCRVADVKEWSTETEWKDEISLEEWGAVRRLEANWMRFKAGNHSNILADFDVQNIQMEDLVVKRFTTSKIE